jgi:hypothetical protein
MTKKPPVRPKLTEALERPRPMPVAEAPEAPIPAQKRLLSLVGMLEWNASYDYKAERSRG